MLTLCVGSNPGPETSPVCLFDLSCSQRVQNFLTVSKPQLRPKQNWSLFSETVWISRDLNNESRQKKKIEFFFSAKTKSRLFFFIKQYVCYLFLLHSGMKTNTVTDITSKTHTHTCTHVITVTQSAQTLVSLHAEGKVGNKIKIHKINRDFFFFTK